MYFKLNMNLQHLQSNNITSFKKYFVDIDPHKLKDELNDYITNPCFEMDLEKELMEYNTKIEDEKYSLENDLSYNDKIDGQDLLEDCQFANSFCRMIGSHKDEIKFSSYCFEPEIYENTYAFKVPRSGIDIIENAYLEINLHKNFNDLTILERYKILMINMELIIGVQRYFSTSMVVRLMTELCNENYINGCDEIIQIPVHNFMTMKYNDEKGLRIPSWNHVMFKFSVDKDIQFFDYKLISNGKMMDGERRHALHKFSKITKNVILNSDQYEFPSDTYTFNLNFNHMSKCLIIYFEPIDLETHILDYYPIITNAKLIIDNVEVLEYDQFEILDFNVLGLKMYIVPLSADFGSWATIKKSLKNLHNFSSVGGIHFSRYGSIRLKLELENINDSYKVQIINLHMNIMIDNCGDISLAFHN